MTPVVSAGRGWVGMLLAVRRELAHFPDRSHQPAPPPKHPEGTIDGWLGGGAGWRRASAQAENAFEWARPSLPLPA
jgi:hypothetical protein